MLRQPGQVDLLAGRPELRPRGSLDVLFVDGQPGAAAGLHDVLGADADVRGVADGPGQLVVAGRRRVRQAVHPDLLRPYADLDLGLAVDERAEDADRVVVVEPAHGVVAVGSLGRPGEEVAHAEEAGHEAGRRALVEALGVAQLLVATLVHHGDPIGHRHRLFLVVGHVDERDPDLLLDPLELDLHLLAQLQVEGAQRLVEEQGGPVDERPGEGDAAAPGRRRSGSACAARSRAARPA